MKVQLSPGERFLNWYPEHTKLYIRGQRGKDWAEQRALDAELARQINEFVATLNLPYQKAIEARCTCGCWEAYLAK